MATVQDLYTSVLGRTPAPEEVAYWSGIFNQYTNPADQAGLFANAAAPELASRSAAAPTATPAAAPVATAAATPAYVAPTLSGTATGRDLQLEMAKIYTNNLDPSIIANTPKKITNFTGLISDWAGTPSEPMQTYLKPVTSLINAVYDENGNLTGYAGNNNAYFNDNSYVHGAFDVTGKANPVYQTKSAGGFFQGQLPAMAALYGGALGANALGVGAGAGSAASTLLPESPFLTGMAAENAVSGAGVAGLGLGSGIPLPVVAATTGGLIAPAVASAVTPAAASALTPAVATTAGAATAADALAKAAGTKTIIDTLTDPKNIAAAAAAAIAADKLTGNKTPTSSTTTSSIDPEMKAAYLRNLDEARAAAAGLGQKQFAAFPEYNLGMVQKYMNPYESQVIQGTLSDIERARQGQISAEGAAATAAKAFGGSRQGVTRSLVDEAALRNATNAVAQLRQGGFAQAQNLGLSQEALRQQYEQSKLDAARNLPLERLNVSQGALSLQPANLGGSTTSPLYQNQAASALGGALGGATLGKLVGGTANPEYAGYGALFGGLLGL